MSKEIPLTRGKVAIVDDEDYPSISAYRWHARVSRTKSDHETWYAERAIGKSKVGMHRCVMAAPSGIRIDHRNGDGLDNQKINLRFATESQNQANRIRRPQNFSGFRGVFWEKSRNRWHAAVKVAGKNIFLGVFHDLDEAARAYDAGAVRHFGEYARTNFPISGAA